MQEGDEIDMMVRALDTNGDNQLSRDEFQRLFSAFPSETSGAAADDITFRLMDSDGNKEVTAEEIRRFDRYDRVTKADDKTTGQTGSSVVSYGLYAVLGILLIAVLFAAMSSFKRC